MANLKSLTVDGVLIEKGGTESAAYETSIATSPNVGASVYYHSTAVNSLSTTVYNIAEGKIVHFYRDEANQYGYAVVGTMTAGSTDNIVWGTPVAFSSAATSGGTNNPGQGLAAATLNGSSKVVIAWAEDPGAGEPSAAHKGTSKVGTISGTGTSATIGFGSETLFEAANYTLGFGWSIDSKYMCSDTIGNRVVLAWQGYGPTYTAPFTLSCVKNGTTTVTTATTAALTVGKEVSGTGITALTHIASITNSTTFVLSRVATDSATSTLTFTDRRLGWASVGTVSGTTVTWNTPGIFGHLQDLYNSANSPNIDSAGTCYNATAQKFVIAYKGKYFEGSGANGSVCKVGTIQGDHSIIFGPDILRSTVNAEGHVLIYDPPSGKTVHFSDDVTGTSSGGSVACGVHSGTDATATITFGTNVTVDTTAGSLTNGIHDTASGQNLLFYKNTISSVYYWNYKSAKVSGTTMTLGPRVRGIFAAGTYDDFPGMAYDPVAKKIIMTPNDTNGAFGFGQIVHFNGATITIDPSTGDFFEIDLESRDHPVGKITINNVNATSSQITSFDLKIIQGPTMCSLPAYSNQSTCEAAGGTWASRQVTWGNIDKIKWIGGTAPTLTNTNNAVDILRFTTYDNGTTWHGKVVGQNFS